MSRVAPRITVLDADPERRRVRLRLNGGDLAPGWLPRDGQDAWCELTAYLDEDGEGGSVVAYGGEVWPAAWPHLFKVGVRTNQGQATRLTDEAAQLVNAALYGIGGET